MPSAPILLLYRSPTDVVVRGGGGEAFSGPVARAQSQGALPLIVNFKVHLSFPHPQ